MRYGLLLLALLMLSGCLSFQCIQQSGTNGSVKSDTEQKPTTPISTSATIPFK